MSVNTAAEITVKLDAVTAVYSRTECSFPEPPYGLTENAVRAMFVVMCPIPSMLKEKRLFPKSMHIANRSKWRACLRRVLLFWRKERVSIRVRTFPKIILP